MHLQTLGRSNLIFSLGLIFTWLCDPQQAGRAMSHFSLAAAEQRCSPSSNRVFQRLQEAAAIGEDNLKSSLHDGGPWKADQACWSSNAGQWEPICPQTRAFWLGKLNYTFGRWNGRPAFKQWQLLFARHSQVACLADTGVTEQPGGPWPRELLVSKRNPITSFPTKS